MSRQTIVTSNPPSETSRDVLTLALKLAEDLHDPSALFRKVCDGIQAKIIKQDKDPATSFAYDEIKATTYMAGTDQSLVRLYKHVGNLTYCQFILIPVASMGYRVCVFGEEDNLKTCLALCRALKIHVSNLVREHKAEHSGKTIRGRRHNAVSAYQVGLIDDLIIQINLVLGVHETHSIHRVAFTNYREKLYKYHKRIFSGVEETTLLSKGART